MTDVLATEAAAFVSRFDLGGDGPRLGIKDSIDIEGFATQAGSRALAGAVPAKRHAAIVRSFLEARWHLVGKTNLHELAYGVTGVNAWTGTPRNPRWPARVPGGSSSGSAVAVAAGAVDVAIGTDTGGSIRVPAACCGILGMKPTFGRVSREGVLPAHSSLDCVGPFALTLPLIEQAMSVMDATYTTVSTPRTVKVGLLNTAAEPYISTTVRDFVGATGPTVVSVTLASFDAAFTAGLHIIAAENWAAFGYLTESGALGTDVLTRLMAARQITPDAVAAGEAVRTTFRAEVDAALEDVDVIALPTLPDYPLLLTAAADAQSALRSTALVRQFNLSGHPAITLPCSTRTGLPVGLQLVGRRGGDAELCAVARRLYVEDFVCQ